MMLTVSSRTRTVATVMTSVTSFDLEGNRIAVRTPNGEVSVKEGPLTAAWVTQTSGAAVKLEGDRIAVRGANGSLIVKEGSLYAGWITVANGVTAFDLSD